jgi:hypothetical protein
MPVTINGSNTPTAGGVTYGDGANYATTTAGTTGQALVSAGAGAPAFGTLPIAGGGTGSTSTTFVNLASNVTGTLPIANGGTNSTATPTAGGIVYGTGTAQAVTAAGTSGQILTSAGASAPTWSTSVAPGYVYLTTITAVSGTNALDVTSTFTTAYKSFALYYNNITNGAYNAQPFNFRIFRAGSLVTSATYGVKTWAPPNTTSSNSSADTAIPSTYIYSKTFPINGWVYVNSPYSSLSGGNDNFSLVMSFMLASASSGIPTYWQTYATNSAAGTFTGIRLYNPEATWGYFGTDVSVDVYGIK